jgi:hypothetical protein
MTRLPFGIEGPFKARRKPIKRYVVIAVAAVVLLGLIVLF